MSDLTAIIKQGLKEKIKPAEQGLITDLIAKVFSTRDILHFAHWNTQKYSKHIAFQDLYDALVDSLDEIVEAYQGKYGLLTNLKTYAMSMPECVCTHVKEEAKWIEDNKDKIANGCPSVANIIDDLVAKYYKTVYKLENLG